MDVDEIQSVQSRERQTDSLQQLRDSFYEEAGEFVRALRAEREQAAARASDPFDAPEVTRLSDDIATAEQTLEAIYERRVGKIVKMASLAAADMPTEEDGLTTEERDLFESLVEDIQSNRSRVFDVLDGASPADHLEEAQSAGTANPEPRAHPPQPDEPPAASSGSGEDTDVAAADLMGASNEDDPPIDPQDEATGRDTETDAENEPANGEQTRGDGGAPTSGTPHEETGDSDSKRHDRGDIDRTRIKITDEVGEILGVDDRSYDLAPNDVVILPSMNAQPLLEQGAAERLE